MKQLYRRRSSCVFWTTLAAIGMAAACGSSDPDEPGGSTVNSAGDAGADGSGSAGDDGSGGASDGGSSSNGDAGSGKPGVNIDAGNDGGAGGSGGEDCGGESAEAAPRIVNLLLLIDKSASMEGVPEDFTTDKWTAMKQALADALEPVESDLNLGLQFFPDPASDAEGDAASCGISGSTLTVDVAAGVDAVPMIEQALDDAEPTGATPTAAALSRALDYFSEGAGAELEGDKVVLLATDGGPNCNAELECGADQCTQNIEGKCTIPGVDNCCDGTPTGCLDDQGAIDQVVALREAGVTTFVIGIPGSAAYVDVLDQLAEEGGAPASDESPKYFKVSDSEALAEVLQSITVDLVKRCEFQLEEDPPELGKINVFIDGEVVPKGDDGWQYDLTTEPPTVLLLGETCEGVESSGADSVEIRFGCPTVEVF